MRVKEKYFIVGIVLTLILAVIGVTYAYWRGVIQGTGSQISVNFDNVSIIFTDDTEIAETKARPGWSTTKTFTVENQGTTLFKYDIYIKNLINTLVTEGYLQYKITSTNGYNMTEFASLPKSETAIDVDLATSIIVEAGVKQEYTIELRYVNDPNFDQSDDIGKSFSGQLMIKENSITTLYDKILADHKTINTRTSFDTVLGDETATTGVIYKESTYREDTTTSSSNNKDVYYFAGNVADNWLEFAGYMWRIIRTNEDGSIRLLYHGSSTTSTDSYIEADTKYNTSSGNTMYVGYMYGSTGSLANNRKYTNSSSIKIKLESWYGTNIDEHDNAVSKTAIYCNDRSASYSEYSMAYAAKKRLESNKRPTYKCGGSADSTELYSEASIADRFSKSTESGGNGKLSQPIGLMTADEVAFAGGLYNTNNQYVYYYLNSANESSVGEGIWWLMSPYQYVSGSYGDVGARVFIVYNQRTSNGNLTRTTTSSEYQVRPALSLKSCVTWESGDGTADNPYTVSVNNTCSVAEN